MPIPLWEWSLTQDTQGGSVGLCMTRHRAMEALSKALIAAGRPASGRIAEVRLIRPADSEPIYLRGFPERKAVYDGSVISWT